MPSVFAIQFTQCRRCMAHMVTQPIAGAEGLASICGDCLTEREKQKLLIATERVRPGTIARALIRMMYNPKPS
jgi:hypothetical protein